MSWFNLFQEMKLYMCDAIGYHAGWLYEHSIWTGTLLESILKDKFTNISEELKDDIIAAAYLHDIGKMYPKGCRPYFDGVKWYTRYVSIPDHPILGYEYLLQRAVPKLYSPEDKPSMLQIPKTSERTKRFVLYHHTPNPKMNKEETSMLLIMRMCDYLSCIGPYIYLDGNFCSSSGEVVISGINGIGRLQIPKARQKGIAESEFYRIVQSFSSKLTNN